MALRTIRIYGDPVLRRKCEPVGAITPDIRTLVEDMIETMYDAPGIGLAAPQVGVLKRLFVLDPSFGEESDSALALIDPVITPIEENDQCLLEEGCLSIPDVRADVVRPRRVNVEYRDVDGAKVKLEADEMLARVIQHEYDHLDGILFVDHLSAVRRQLLSKQLRGLARSQHKQQKRKTRALA